MSALRSYIALVLLTCFTRVLVPDAWLLALHAHKHTEQEVTGKKSPLLSAKHQHCSVDHFYDVPFQPSALVALVPISPTYAHAWLMPELLGWRHTFAATTYLRGPPALLRVS